MKSYIENMINSPIVKNRGIFDIQNLKNEWKKFLEGKFETSFFIWQFINTEIWFQVFIDKQVGDVSKTFKFNT